MREMFLESAVEELVISDRTRRGCHDFSESRGPKFDMKKTRNKKKKKKMDMFFRETCAAGRLTRSLACCTRCTTLRRATIAAVSAALAIWKSLQLLQFFPSSMIMQSKLHQLPLSMFTLTKLQGFIAQSYKR
jgi:hypothetical protein